MVMRLVSGSTGLSWSAEECGALAASVSRDDNNNSAALVTASLPSLMRPGEFRSRMRPPSSPRPVLFRSGGLVTARCGWCSQRCYRPRGCSNANDISDEAPDLGILVDEGYVSDDSVGEDGSEQGDVVNGLFAELRTKCRKCCCKKATSSRIWTAVLIRLYEKRVGMIKSKLLLACLLKSIPLYSAADCL